MNNINVIQFLQSWGLHFDTLNGESSVVSYAQVYLPMLYDANKQGGKRLQKFISNITNTVEDQTYLEPDTAEEIQKLWEGFQS